MTVREVIYDDDGEPLLATCVEEPLTNEQREAPRALALWVRERIPAPTPEQIERQQAANERNRQRLERLGIARRSTEED